MRCLSALPFPVNGADGVKCSQGKRSFRLSPGNFSNGTAHVRERTGKGALPEHASVARVGGGGDCRRLHGLARSRRPAEQGAT